LASTGDLLAGTPGKGLLIVLSTAGFGQNAIQLHLSVEPPEQAIKAFSLTSFYDGHIASTLLQKSRHGMLVAVSQITGNDMTF
jgi:hypothetical protein